MVCGIVAGAFYRPNLNGHSIEDIFKLIGNPIDKAIEYGFSIICALIVTGICTVSLDKIYPGASKRVSDLFWEEFGNMWRVTTASITGFCCATLVIFINRPDVTNSEDVANVHGLVLQAVWFFLVSVVLCLLPSIIRFEKSNPTIPNANKDNNSASGEK